MKYKWSLLSSVKAKLVLAIVAIAAISLFVPASSIESENIVAFGNAVVINEIEAPKITIKYVNNSKVAFDKYITASKGNEAMKSKLLVASEKTPIVEDTTIASSFAYKSSIDSLVYNPNKKNGSYCDTNFVFSHEYAHAVDVKEIQSWKDKEFIYLIEEARLIVSDNLETITDWYDEDGVYRNDSATSDIISALTEGSANDYLPATHRSEYWNQTTESLEIFANLTAIDMSEKDYSQFKSLFGDLFDKYERMVIIYSLTSTESSMVRYCPPFSS